MAKPAAKQGDKVVAVDTHVVMVPSPSGAVPTPTPMPFNGVLNGDLSPDVLFEKLPAATVGSTAANTPAHVPVGGPFQKPPSNQGKVQTGSATVLINKKQAVGLGDPAMTCNDPADAPNGQIVCAGTVLVGK